MAVNVWLVPFFLVAMLIPPLLGTTGTPKGVDVTHRNVCNLVCVGPGDLGITSGSRVGQVLNVSFDMGKSSSLPHSLSVRTGNLTEPAAWEMLGCLCNGGTLMLRGSDWKQTLKEVRNEKTSKLEECRVTLYARLTSSSRRRVYSPSTTQRSSRTSEPWLRRESRAPKGKSKRSSSIVAWC